MRKQLWCFRSIYVSMLKKSSVFPRTDVMKHMMYLLMAQVYRLEQRMFHRSARTHTSLTPLKGETEPRSCSNSKTNETTTLCALTFFTYDHRRPSAALRCSSGAE